jgi:murein DD-endopeptidase MepM/ murein hydrolase activator NlpD
VKHLVRTWSYAIVGCILLAGCQGGASDRNSGRLPAPAMRKISEVQYDLGGTPRKATRQTLPANLYLSDILTAEQVSQHKIDQVVRKSAEIFDLRQLRAGNPYTILRNAQGGVEYFVYESTPSEYIVFDLRDSIQVFAGRKPVTRRVREAGGIIGLSLFETVRDNGIDVRLAKLMEEAFAWTVDFFHTRQGDAFRVLYEEELVDGLSVGISRVLAAEYRHAGKSWYALAFGDSGQAAFFDETGNNLQGHFLKAPMSYAGLEGQPASASEVQGGADYEAPEGTPVRAVGEGIVRRTRRHPEGYEVQVEHGNGLTAQYQYLPQLASAVRPGRKVAPGDILGYLGADSSGQAALSFRFLQQGRLINELEVSTASAAPIPDSLRAQFDSVRAQYLARLARIPFTDPVRDLAVRYRQESAVQAPAEPAAAPLRD